MKSNNNGQWHGGKGSRTRRGRNDSEYRNNWDRIFGNVGGETDGKDRKGKGEDQKG